MNATEDGQPVGENPEVTVPHDDLVNHPKHYVAHPSGIECIQITRDMGFAAGNAVKYVWRADLKNGRQDLEKARWYLNDAINSGGIIFTGSNCEGWRERLGLVYATELETMRATFFWAIRTGSLVAALRAVEALLARAEA
jgi:hypothetical protein